MAANNGAVQRNFYLPIVQAEWLREYAHRARRPQAEIVREALAEYQARAEGGATATPDDRNRALTERFREGRGIDLDVLRDEDGAMWTHDP